MADDRASNAVAIARRVAAAERIAEECRRRADDLEDRRVKVRHPVGQPFYDEHEERAVRLYLAARLRWTANAYDEDAAMIRAGEY